MQQRLLIPATPEEIEDFLATHDWLPDPEVYPRQFLYYFKLYRLGKQDEIESEEVDPGS